MAKSATLEEKIAKAEEEARMKAEAEGLDEAATQEAVNEAVAKVKKTAEKTAEKTAKEKNPSWLVKVKNNPDFCGIGAGGVQFADGQATVTSERMADWFTEHDGYEVTKQ